MPICWEREANTEMLWEKKIHQGQTLFFMWGIAYKIYEGAHFCQTNASWSNGKIIKLF